MSKYDHTPEAVDAMRDRLLACKGAAAQARLVLDRERILTDTLQEIATVGGHVSQRLANSALRDLAAYDSPAPTLLEAAKEFVENEGRTLSSATNALNALRAAVEREEAKVKP